MKKMLLLAGLIAGTFIAQESCAREPDFRIREKLDSLRYNYRVDQKGVFSITIQWDNGRSQEVYIFSTTENLANMEIRQIWSVGYSGTLSENALREMLKRSERLKIGAWGLSSEGDEAYFTAKVPANLDAASLRTVCSAVAKEADNFEQKNSGQDEL